MKWVGVSTRMARVRELEHLDAMFGLTAGEVGMMLDDKVLRHVVGLGESAFGPVHYDLMLQAGDYHAKAKFDG